ncbi:MAG: hypothetical protein ABIJ21_01830 [Nanoarchaeota archaeon]
MSRPNSSGEQAKNVMQAFISLPEHVRAYLVQELRLSQRLAAPVVHAAEVGLEDLLSPLKDIPSFFEKLDVYKEIRRGLQDVCDLYHRPMGGVYRSAAVVLLPYALQMHAAVRF